MYLRLNNLCIQTIICFGGELILLFPAYSMYFYSVFSRVQSIFKVAITYSFSAKISQFKPCYLHQHVHDILCCFYYRDQGLKKPLLRTGCDTFLAVFFVDIINCNYLLLFYVLSCYDNCKVAKEIVFVIAKLLRQLLSLKNIA